MLRIRLTRTGKRKQASYRIVVSEKRSKRDGQQIAYLGHYYPTHTPAKAQLDIEAYDSWISKGAQPTETVAFLRSNAKAGEFELTSTTKRKPFIKKFASDTDQSAPQAPAAEA